MPRFCDSFSVKPISNPIGGHIIQDIIISPYPYVSQQKSNHNDEIFNYQQNINVSYPSISHQKSNDITEIYNQTYQQTFNYYLNLFQNL